MNKKQVMLIGSVGFLIILTIVNYNQLNKISNQLGNLSHLENTVQDISYSIGDIHNQVGETLYEFTEEKRWVRNNSYEVKEVNGDTEQVEVLVSWGLRELEDDEELYFLYREQGKSDWQKLKVEETGNLDYEVTFTLSLKENYESRILAVSDEGKRSEDLQYIAIFDQLQERIYSDVYVLSYGKDFVDLQIMMQQSYRDQMFRLDSEKLEIKSATANLYVNNKLVKTIDVLEKANKQVHDQMYEYSQRLTFEEQPDLPGDVRVDLTIIDGLGLEYKINSYGY
ncbi:hypothetical protein [Alkalihalobacterium elongatum]|uniref:hypothetical protein n=1 Tax=Alkalihalobacterium elongatum TaxID=2675466 RepID=UPI001C1FCF2B|nr:hypothetical protein [Alkalihalobacterium elongatum]